MTSEGALDWTVVHPRLRTAGGSELTAALVAQELDARVYAVHHREAALRYLPALPRGVTGPRWGPWFGDGFLGNAEVVARLLTARLPGDVLFLNDNFALQRALVERRPTVAYLHRAPDDPYGTEARAAERVTVLLANSESTAEGAEEVLGRAVDAVVPPPVHVDAFTPSAPGERFLTGGRFHRWKGFHRAIEAAARSGVPLDIFGGGVVEDELRTLAERLDAPVRFLGKIPTEELVARYEACRGFVFPSVGEPFGLTPLEAMAAGKVVLASADSGGPFAYLEPGTNALVWEDVSELAEQMTRFDDAWAAGQVDACRATAEAYGPTAFVERVVDLLQERM